MMRSRFEKIMETVEEKHEAHFQSNGGKFVIYKTKDWSRCNYELRWDSKTNHELIISSPAHEDLWRMFCFSRY